ncbi:hypothetical protein BH20ACT18_BH20ACT18_04690 [soil metagenome]
MLTVPEAARRVARNPETIRRWIREGKLPAERIGTQWIIEEDDLDVVMNGGMQMPRPEGRKRTFYGEPMPDVVAAIRRSRMGH